MRGQLLISGHGQPRQVDLSAGASSLSLSSREVNLHFEWDASAATWQVLASPDILLNGQPLRGTTLLRDADAIEVAEASAVFSRIPDPPRLHGRELNSFPLGKVQSLVFGRGPGEAGEEPDRVELDPADSQISRRHVAISRDGERFKIKDESQYGSLLNGQRFDERPLIIGDRFKIGLYSFEFTGTAIKRVRPRIGGKVSAHNLSFEAGGRRILNDVSVEIAPCSFVGILGGSGQGKSTLMNALCGMNPATAGEVRIEGEPVGAGSSSAAAGIGYVPQDDIVHPELTVEQAITYSARLRLDSKIPAAEIAALVTETIDRLGLAEHRHKRISNLSGGQRKRVSIATELLDKPAVLFLDEPSSGLDPATEYALMKLLRRLAGYDCTVVCTTHVLGRSYLFDRILFIHGGRLVFNGTPDEAYAYFQVESLDQVYINLDESTRSPEQMQADFAAWRQQVGDSAPASRTPELPIAADPADAPKRGAGYLASLLVQIQRLGSITVADKLNPVFLAAQPALIGILVGWVAEDFVLRLFMCIVATLWFGCSNGAQQIVRERPIFRRERVCGLGLNSYVQSKYLFLGSITTLQALALLLITQATVMVVRPYERPVSEYRERLAELLIPKTAQPGAGIDEDFLAVGEGASQAPAAPPAQKAKNPASSLSIHAIAWISTFFETRQNMLDTAGQSPASIWNTFALSAGLKFVALLLTAVVGVAIGLAISAVVETSTQSVMWVPLILIPQILFGGVVLKRAELSRGGRLVSYLSPSYSCQRLIDVSNLSGLAVPLLSNQTKVPLFLTAGVKERVDWTVSNRNYTETYDKLSPVNTSWQNLVVMPAGVGEHRHEYTLFETSTGSLRKIYQDTVSVRNDVLYRKGTLFTNTHPAARSLLSLAIWTALCYAITLGGLMVWQKGK